MGQNRGIFMRNKECERALMMQKLVNKEENQMQVALKLNLSVRHVKRLKKSFILYGIEGLQSKHRGGNSAYSDEFKTQVMSNISKHYSDFGPTLAAEKLLEYHQLKINRETLRTWMIEAGYHTHKKRRNAKIHQSRQRREHYGELIQIDGSHHDWFEGRSEKCCLLVFVDDSTSKIMHLRFEESENTMGYMRCFDAYIKTHGIPMAIYSDKFSVFTVNTQGVSSGITQLQRAMHTLGIEMILANSPQAKGRVERANATLQDRLVKELRLRGISSIHDANKFIPKFIAEYNAKFAVEPAQNLDFHKVAKEELQAVLPNILCLQEQRKVTKNLEFSYKNMIFRIKDELQGAKLRKASVSVCERMDNSVVVLHNDKILQHDVISIKRKTLKVADSKDLDGIMDRVIEVPTLLVLKLSKGVSLCRLNL